MSYIILLVLFLIVFWSNSALSQKQECQRLPIWFFHVLLIYHIGFALVFTFYIKCNGGDALYYWNLEGNDLNWMDYWGSRSEFLQWLNYLPSKYIGMSFLQGNFLYAVFSFLGMRQLILMILPTLSEKLNTQGLYFVLALFFLPNLHFWTSGIGKEALLFTGIVWVFMGLRDFPKFWIYAVFGLLLNWWVRPVMGASLLIVLMIDLFLKPHVSPLWKIGLGITSVIIGIFISFKLSEMMHLTSWSWTAFNEFSISQFSFLSGFHAGSEVPMQQYSILQRIYAVLYRPDFGDITHFWSFIAAFENMISLLLLFLSLVLIFVLGIPDFPRWIWSGVLLFFLMSIVHIFTLNNLGIMMRMKSIYMIFFYIWISFPIAFHIRNFKKIFT